ncbi:FKBP-type peptidyl-prolyl cis-trans isomerase [Sphingosinicella humi]|uniref:Peptidyl-prolyl cis-trans isomerase n=1 Tax=Allosphingosinicella humi TaxID=2068657 RepID=A0A2U2J2S3_9SPHN|nr:FKBP-type peptidyl-prolyl cis-trans isomerase [Sphingosinicella humi]PWG02653.1 peptidylprolyl isomerase [Sphingosinicella humi]
MSVTAVPIRPIKKGSVTKLWIGLAALSLAAGALAWAGTAGQHYVTTESGLQFRVVSEGEGPHPAPTDIVLIDYTGTLEDGTVFDTSEGRQPVPLPVMGSIPGFAEGLQMMRKGGTYRLRIPSELAYGATGAGDAIPPDADLQFEVTLIDFVPASALQGMGIPPPGM